MIKKYLKKCWKENAGLLVLISLSSVTKIAGAFMTATAINAVVSKDFEVFRSAMFIVLFLYLFQIILQSFRVWYEAACKNKMLVLLRQDLIGGLVKLDVQTAKKYDSGTMLSWILTDMERMEKDGFSSVYKIIETLLDFTLSVSALFYLHWGLSVIMIALAYLTIILPKLREGQLQDSFQTFTKEQESFVTQSTNLLQGFIPLYAVNGLNFMKKGLFSQIEKLVRSEMKAYKALAIVTFLAALGNVVGQIGVLSVSSFFAIIGLISLGDIMSVSNLTDSVFNGFSNLSSALIQLRTVQPLIEKYQLFFTTVNELEERENGKVALTGAEMLNLSLSNVTFYQGAYPKQPFTRLIKDGDRLALVGSSGSGKSSLLKLISGQLENYDGQANLGGVELSQIKKDSLTSLISYIAQTPFIFNATIKENIIVGRAYDEKVLEDVIAIVGLTDLINALPDGLDTLIGEEGLALSGGQQQRVALARGLVTRSKFILIDEGTANLDKQSSTLIEANILKRYDQSTIMMVSHHFENETLDLLDDVVYV